MPDSSITKHALASALRSLMQEMPFDRIRVSYICKRCGLNRQSFYYHFQDKYELMNWIFDMDFMGPMGQEEDGQPVAEMTALLRALYEHRAFYRNALSVQGQNSLREHVREIALPILQKLFQEALPTGEDDGFYQEFFLDALLGAVVRWVSDESCEAPETFIPRFFSRIILIAKYILGQYPSP